MEAIISDIQKFSLHDGPGIRTTVFFKGCNMHCVWCHNPETFSIKQDLMFFSNKCIGCGSCYSACKTGALTKDLQRVYNKELCIRCGACVEACAPGALKLVGKKMTVEELMAVIREDVDYYRSSGGGVTLSGGEVLLQADFAAQLLKACKEEGIDTAIESNLSGSFENIEKLLPYLDRVYCDIKLLDDDAHIRYTGLSNKHTLENIARLKEYSIPVTVRTPLIPGVTDGAENISGIARWIRENAKVVSYELLNYNPLAEAKCEELGMSYDLSGLKRKTSAELKALASLAQKEGVATMVGGE